MHEIFDIRQYRDKTIVAKQDSVVTEQVVTVVINRETIIRHSMSPALYKEFVTGFLLTSGMVPFAEDIIEASVDNERITVTVNNFQPQESMVKGASGGFVPHEMKNGKFPRGPALDFTGLIPLFEEFSARSTVFRKTGGTHSAALSEGGKVLCFAEDIGRHNAMDKAVGMGVLEGEDLSRMVLLTSGRISAEIVQKASNAGIPAIISHSAPTSLAIRRATQFKMTLIGFLRGDRFNIYTL